MSRPSCSVVIPAYNALAYLPSVIASVEVQRVPGIEVLVMDDGSTDGTGDWLDQARHSRPWLRVFKGGGLGPARGRNLLIENAQSDLIAFLDADDTWRADKLKREIGYHAVHGDVAFTFTDYLHVDPQGGSLGTAFGYWKPRLKKTTGEGFAMLDNPLAQLIGCNLAGTSTVVAKRKSLQNANGFAVDLPSAEDWDLWLRMAETGKVAVSSRVTMDYLVRPGSETSNRAARIAAMETVLSRYDHAGVPLAARLQARGRIHAVRAEEAAIAGRPAGALAWRIGALALRPSRRNGLEAAAAALRLVRIGGRSIKERTA